MSLRKLIDIASLPIGPDLGPMGSAAFDLTAWGDRGTELYELLRIRNGFYALESSLLLRGIGNASPPLDLPAWNSPDLWVGLYDAFKLGPMLFFGEDVFGFQFALASDHVVSFNPETGRVAELAQSLDQWASVILGDYAYHTGYTVAHEWQSHNGPLKPGRKLAPKTPFVCGGKSTPDNIGSISELESMTFRAYLATQIKDLPDGAKIKFKIVD